MLSKAFHHWEYTLRLFDFSSSVLESISGLPRLGKNMEREKKSRSGKSQGNLEK